MNTKFTAIMEKYDTSAIITADSDPAQEFAIYQEQCRREPEFYELELTQQDFADYIASLAVED